MKKLVFILTLVICFTGFDSRSQDWAPDGAEWYYDYENFWYTGYVHISVLGDTLINDTVCRILKKRITVRDQINDTTTSHYLGRSYMYSEGEKVYIYENNKFYVLYDFSAVPGDTLIIPQNGALNGPGSGCEPEGKIVVTDTTTVSINGKELRKIQVLYPEESHWALYGDIIETIGPVNHYMLPEPTYYCVVDVFEGGPLRCYSDPEFGLYSTGISPECDYLVSVSELNETEIEIYPNPARGILNIIIPENRRSIFTVYNSSGTEIFSRILTRAENSIDVSDLKAGLYFVRIESENESFSRHLVIQ